MEALGGKSMTSTLLPSAIRKKLPPDISSSMVPPLSAQSWSPGRIRVLVVA